MVTHEERVTVSEGGKEGVAGGAGRSQRSGLTDEGEGSAQGECGVQLRQQSLPP